MKAIDVSTFQGDINWEKVKDDGIEAVIIRAGFRTTKDNKFEANIKGARKVGLHIGIYWFGYSYTNDMARVEAEFCLKTIEPYKNVIDLPVFYDWEEDSMRYAKQHGVKPTKAKITKWNRIFCEAVKEEGYIPGIYFNYDYKRNYLAESVLKKYDRWLAFPSSQEDKTVDIQQYTFKGKVNGIKGDVDMDKIYKKYWEEKEVPTVRYEGKLTKHFTIEEYTVGNAPNSVLTIGERQIDFAHLLEKFRVWLKRPMTVTSWKRTAALNKEVGGVANSNHLYGTACDWHTNIKIDVARFIKYAKKWKRICKKHGFVGEAGLYPWGIHFGIQTDEQIKINGGKFFHWQTVYVKDPKTGKQVAKQTNNPFRI